MTPAPEKVTPLFQFASQGKVLTVDTACELHAPITPELISDFLTAGAAHRILCGIIPFDTLQPSTLWITDQYRWESSSATENPVATSTTQRNAAPSRSHDQQYLSAVAHALQLIPKAGVHKIVLARQQHLSHARGIGSDAAAQHTFTRLLSACPTADVFRAYTGQETHWVGASPEVIADVQDRRFTTHPLAGSLPKAVEPSPTRATSLLTTSEKDLREHAYVVEYISEVLKKIGLTDLNMPDKPTITETDSMWHLGTPIAATTSEGLSSLDIALALHPTPAVAGVPLESALNYISQLEQEPRSYYSGLVGWMDGEGNGRWSLVLRCARHRPDCTTLFAGAGIVAGSQPTLELQETEAKMQTVLHALNAA
ncbi:MULTISPECIES: isochorismate synthase [Rothia]|uniref:isochorismate synthase n=1 Tax=Rothia nasimurium TaxID=85336 RepID=A0A1Y1RN17_9MICC|nr:MULTISPECIES: isochorismate synthase [Rothia]ORC15964.1 hypothetical protein A7979_04930 [Rothia nasimurium]